MPDINMRHGKWKEYCVHANHLEFCVRQYGDEAGIPLLLIMGLGCQMTFWPQSFINALVDAGFHVYCFDNRDVGLSARVPTSRRIDTRLAFLRHRMGLRFQTDYTLFDMACDTAHLIDQLDLRPFTQCNDVHNQGAATASTGLFPAAQTWLGRAARSQRRGSGRATSSFLAGNTKSGLPRNE